jgi:predicted O-methyltransferase YrrM
LFAIMPQDASQETWSAVDRYLTGRVVAEDAALERTLRSIGEAGLPEISVSPNQGKLLHLMARAAGVRRILEIGTLGGYSTIWLARALPEGGRLITLEADPAHAKVASRNIANAGLSTVVELRIGKALETLPILAAEHPEPFDLFFIDADKVNTSAYFDWALKLARQGSLIVVDNVVRDGAVADERSTDTSVRAMRSFFDRLSVEKRVDATAIQTVGSKGYDGLAFAIVTDPAR